MMKRILFLNWTAALLLASSGIAQTTGISALPDSLATATDTSTSFAPLPGDTLDIGAQPALPDTVPSFESPNLEAGLDLSSSGRTDTLTIDARKAVLIALDGSPEVVRARNSEETARLSYHGTQLDLYSPRIDLNLQTPSFRQQQVEQDYYDTDLGRYVRGYLKTENRLWSGVFDITQPLPTGGQFNFESSLFRQFYSSPVIGDTLDYTSSWRVQFSQELLKGNLRRVAKERAQIGFKRTMHSGVRARRQLAFNVLQSFYNLVASRRELSITQEDLQASRETANLARRKYEAGLIPEVEALQLEVEVAQKEAELSSAVSTYAASLDRFRVSLGLDLDQPLAIVGDPTFSEVEVSLDSAVAQALSRREDLQLAQLDVKQADLNLADAKRPWRPSGQISAFYDLNSREGTLDRTVSSNPNDYDTNRGVTFTLGVPLFSGGRRNTDVQQAEIARRQAQYDAEQSRTEVVLEVRDAIRQLREARQRYEITLRSLDIARTSYEITRNRFENGQVTARSWIDAQLSLKRNRISALRALIDHNLAVARYRLAVGQDILPGLAE